MCTRTPLINAVMKSNLELVDLLLAEKHDPNELDSQGVSPLIHAADSLSLDIVKSLIGAGANVDFQCETNGYTPLFMAFHNNNEALVDMLKSFGATVC